MKNIMPRNYTPVEKLNCDQTDKEKNLCHSGNAKTCVRMCTEVRKRCSKQKKSYET